MSEQTEPAGPGTRPLPVRFYVALLVAWCVRTFVIHASVASTLDGWLRLPGWVAVPAAIVLSAASGLVVEALGLVVAFVCWHARSCGPRARLILVVCCATISGWATCMTWSPEGPSLAGVLLGLASGAELVVMALATSGHGPGR